jgi:hypothetical protein
VAALLGFPLGVHLQRPLWWRAQGAAMSTSGMCTICYSSTTMIIPGGFVVCFGGSRSNHYWWRSGRFSALSSSCPSDMCKHVGCTQVPGESHADLIGVGNGVLFSSLKALFDASMLPFEVLQVKTQVHLCPLVSFG